MLKKKNAVVTGSTSGIGLGIARALAAEGANVMLNGFGDKNEIEALRAGLEKEYKVKVAYSDADLSKADDVKRLIKVAIDAMGSVDVLVNNAGMQHVSPVEEFPDDKWEMLIRLNLSAAFYAMKAAIPGMKQKGWGRIINIASAHGLVASANKSAYVASKHGLLGLTKSAALENAKGNITVNAICPGWVLTPLVQKQVDAMAERDKITVKDAELKLLLEKQPAQRFVTPEEVGALAVFLCSDAARTMTGANLSLDGGWTAQ
jgi:3-hydroxybutyrate dehydrogenase